MGDVQSCKAMRFSIVDMFTTIEVDLGGEESGIWREEGWGVEEWVLGERACTTSLREFEG